jgi:hypothetical protein
MCDQTDGSEPSEIYQTLVRCLRARLEMAAMEPGMTVGNLSLQPDRAYLGGYRAALFDVLDEVAYLAAKHSNWDAN